MRSAFARKLKELAGRNGNIHLITADTGFTVFDDFQKEFPDRYLNIGIMESAMIGVAAGLALSGKTVFVYGIIPFVTMRCFEQIRTDICFHNLPVRIVGVGEGLLYGSEGATHHAVEDIAVMSSLPGMKVVCPGDPVETEIAIEASMREDGPFYFRLSKGNAKVLHSGGAPALRIGKAVEVREGREIALISTGNMLETALKVGDSLRQAGLSPAIISMHTIKPVDREFISRLPEKCRIIATLEEHSIIGGLGSIVSDVIASENLDVTLFRFALPDRFITFAGGHDYLLASSGLSSQSITDRLLDAVSGETVIKNGCRTEKD